MVLLAASKSSASQVSVAAERAVNETSKQIRALSRDDNPVGSARAPMHAASHGAANDELQPQKASGQFSRSSQIGGASEANSVLDACCGS